MGSRFQRNIGTGAVVIGALISIYLVLGDIPRMIRRIVIIYAILSGLPLVFFNTFRLDMDGIYKIQIWRDEEYMLRAKLIGNCVITDQGDEGALERGVIVQSDLKGVWDYSYSAKLIQCFPELATTNYLLQEDRTAVECTMGISRIKVCRSSWSIWGWRMLRR